MKPGIQCVRTHWNWGFIAFHRARRPAALDGDPDGDPVDAAGMAGGTEDQGVGPGGDPERFGDLIEQ
jgi:hypothetical protein